MAGKGYADVSISPVINHYLIDEIVRWFRIGHVAVSEENRIELRLSDHRSEGERNVIGVELRHIQPEQGDVVHGGLGIDARLGRSQGWRLRKRDAGEGISRVGEENWAPWRLKG